MHTVFDLIINNKMTSLAPISPENPSSVAQQNQRIRHSHVHVQCKKSPPMDGGAKKLRRIGNFEKIGFQITCGNQDLLSLHALISVHPFFQTGSIIIVI